MTILFYKRILFTDLKERFKLKNKESEENFQHGFYLGLLIGIEAANEPEKVGIYGKFVRPEINLIHDILKMDNEEEE